MFSTRMLRVPGKAGPSSKANRWVMHNRGLNLAPLGATIQAGLASYLLPAKELNADSQFHHRLRARARHSAVRRPAARFHAAGSLFARGRPDPVSYTHLTLPT